MMAFDKNHDGKLTRDEITDPRLLRLFDRADTNHDGVVTKEELTALAKKMIAENNSGGSRGPGGPGGGGGPGEGDGPGRFWPAGRLRSAAVRSFAGEGLADRLPNRARFYRPVCKTALKMTAAQKKKLAALQKEVDAKLADILTDDQKRQIKSMRPRGDGPPPRNRRGQGGGPEEDGPPDDRF